MEFLGTVYSVSERLPGVEDESWHEYEVELLSGDGGMIDRWDSLAETYNGVKGQRLSRESAEEAIEEIKQDVKNGEADAWFNTEALQ